MDNRDLNENTENLTPEELLAKIKEKMALDIDTYSKIVDEQTQQSSFDDEGVREIDELDISVAEQTDNVGELEEIDEFVADFESTEEIEAVGEVYIDNSDEAVPVVGDIKDTVNSVEINRHEMPVDEVDDYNTEEFASVDNVVRYEESAPETTPIISNNIVDKAEADDDYMIRDRIAQLFSDFDDDISFVPAQQSEPVADNSVTFLEPENDVTKIIPSISETTIGAFSVSNSSEVDSADIYPAISVNPVARPKVYRFRKYDPTLEQTRMHEAARYEEEPEYTRTYQAIPTLETPDLNVMQTFGASVDYVRELYGDNVASEYEKVLVQSENQAAARPTVENEYVSVEQNKDIIAEFKKKISTFKVRNILCAISCLFMLILENLSVFGYKIPGIFDPQAYPISHIMIDLQLLVICGALAFPVLKKGFKNILSLEPSPSSMALCIFAVACIVDIISCFVGGDIVLYNFAAGFALLLSLVYESKIVVRDYRAFKVISSDKVKSAAIVGVGNSESPEVTAYEQLDDGEEVKVVHISKGNFISDFFSRTKQSDSSPHDKVLLPLTVALMVIIFVISLIMHHDASLALKSAHMSFSVFVPFAVYYSLALPISKASEHVYESGSAIIGDAALEEYSGSSIITFSDTDIFPSYCVKLKSVKVYGESRIDRILYNASSVFSKLGGPLSDVFSVSTIEIGTSDNVEIANCLEDGIEAYVDGRRILIGKSSFLAKYNIYARNDETDDNKYNHMFIAEGNFLSAKFYIKYSLDVDFENVIARMAGCGICGILKTYDPNIDNELLARYIDTTKYPIRVVKLGVSDQSAEVAETISSGVVSISGAKSTVDATVTAERLYNIRSSTNSVKILALIIGVIHSVFITIFKISPFHSAIIVLYQLLWMIPTLISTKLYIIR